MTHPTRPPRGFTLIEVLIVTVIIGILAAVALPSYSSYVTKTRRTDATVFLTEAAGEQMRYRSERNTYAGDLAELGYGSAAMRTEEGHYDVSVVAAKTGANTFELVATPVAGGPQASDAACPALRITATGKRTPAECW